MSYELMPWNYGLIIVFLFACLVGCAVEAVERWRLGAPRRTEKRLAKLARKERHRSFMANRYLVSRQMDLDRASRALTRAKFDRSFRNLKETR